MKLHHLNPAATQTRFRRHECKYLISESQAREIRDYAAPFVVPDPYAAASPDRSYDIVSLYLDSPEMRLYEETQDGLLHRIKLRIRSYDDFAAMPVFLEIKRRFNSLVLKGRSRIELADMPTVLAGGLPGAEDQPPDQAACSKEFAAWVIRWLAEPKVGVRYRREAYVGTFHRDIRLTMDRNLICHPAPAGGIVLDGSDWRDVEPEKVVLEIKFDENFPHWVNRLVRRFQLQRRSYSKYGYSVQRGLLAPRPIQARAVNS